MDLVLEVFQLLWEGEREDELSGVLLDNGIIPFQTHAHVGVPRARVRLPPGRVGGRFT